MEIIVEISDELLDKPVRDAVSVAVNQIVRRIVDKKINELLVPIEKAVEIYLAKRYTSEQMEAIIHKAVNSEVLDRIKELTRG